MIITTEKSSHWYFPDGTPCHTVKRVDGKGERNTTLRDARKLGLLPSVTSILSVWPKPGLDAWKLEQAILAAITLPKKDNETTDEFVKRVVEDMDAERDKAAATGSAFHDAIRFRIVSGRWPDSSALRQFFDAWEPWISENLIETEISEQVLVNQCDGYAGTVDWVGKTYHWGRAALDFKGQSVKRGKPQFYDTWAMQLVAYGGALAFFPRSLVSVVLNRDTPEPPYVSEWSQDDCAVAIERFNAALQVWQLVNNYKPEAKHE